MFCLIIGKICLVLLLFAKCLRGLIIILFFWREDTFIFLYSYLHLWASREEIWAKGPSPIFLRAQLTLALPKLN